MPKPSQTVEINNFISGLITEASPTNFPPTASKDEKNFILNRDGTRDRRLGMDNESLGADVATGLTPTEALAAGNSTFLWENVAEDPSLNFSVIQILNKVYFFDTTVSAPSANGNKGSITITASSGSTPYSFTAVDGVLVVATGEQELTVISYDSIGDSFSQEQVRLLVRDLWGLEDLYEGNDLTLGGNVITEPATLSDPHLYNLRNQSWAFPRRLSYSNVLDDPLNEWRDKNATTWPAHIHSIWTGMEYDPDDGIDTEEFSARLMRESVEGVIPAARGHFIIDLLNRGASRVEAEVALRAQYTELDYEVTAVNIPADSTPNGASTVVEYAGRVFYAGFSGSITDGDTRSPRLQSYVCFSKLIESPAEINQCYSSGDPTSRDSTDIVDTDGGFIRISGARKILQLVNLGSALFVVADNGVWMVRGGSGFGFSATNYEVTKITDYGCISPKSVVTVGTTLYYWAEDGIYTVATDQFGDYKAVNLTEATIQSFYNLIGPVEQAGAQGIYDKFNRTIRWLYDRSTTTSPTKEVKELVLDLDLQAWIPYDIKNLDTATPLVRAIFETPPISSSDIIENVVVGVDQVQVAAADVFITETAEEATIRTLKYLTFDVTNPSDTTFTFAEYKNTGFRDWTSVDLTGADAKAYLITGDVTAGSTAVDKQVPYLFMHFRRTEDGFEDDGTGDLRPTNPSGCMVQSRWDFSNSTASNRWSRAFQGYRYRRPYFASGLSDDFDTGFELISTKNKLRGKGKAFSLYLETEPDKDCQIVGWAVSVNGNRIS